MNADLKALFEADKNDHSQGLQHGTSVYNAMRERDRQRRQDVRAMIDAGHLKDAEDYYHAAKIFQHGDTPEDAWTAYTLALRAVELNYRPARWLSAAAFDRWRMYSGEPQKYGTQYVWDGYRDRLWDVDSATTNAERAEWDVPPLAEQLWKAEEASRNRPASPVGEDAPKWLKDALKRWGLI